jgi:hypothetical protein
MVIIDNCKTFKPFCEWEKPKELLIFGRIARIKRYDTDQVRKRLLDRGYHVECLGKDESGTMYEIWTDYDAVLVSSDAVAIVMEGEKNEVHERAM